MNPPDANSDDVQMWFAYAGARDSLGYEAEAQQAYERVAAIGIDALPPADIPRYYVQAGSTLRNIGRPNEARALLDEGRRRFPDNRALDAFYALASWSCGDPREAVQCLLRALIASGDASATRYARSIAAYADDLEPLNANSG